MSVAFNMTGRRRNFVGQKNDIFVVAAPAETPATTVSSLAKTSNCIAFATVAVERARGLSASKGHHAWYRHRRHRQFSKQWQAENVPMFPTQSFCSWYHWYY